MSDLDKCSSCANGDQSLYSDETKSSIANALSSMREWCKKDDPEPPVIVDPEEIDTTEEVEVKNPFTNEPSSSNSNSSSSSSTKIPTWGIGVAAGGGAAVLAAAALVAYNYQCQCDHDRHRLKRRRRKSKKQKKDDEMPTQEQQQPQVVGYLYPTGTEPQAQSGYFAPGVAATQAQTPMSSHPSMSPPVSFAHTPLSPPGSPPPLDPRMSYPYPQGQPQQGYPQPYGQ
jgi:hypothetical protein